jgi:hypothetical protein
MLHATDMEYHSREGSPSSAQEHAPIQQESATSFLDFPAEIRLYIYELSLTDLTERPACPCTKARAHRFATFWGLSLTSKEISSEVTSLFRKKYIDQACLYFDEVVSLHDFYQYASGREHLKELQFCLRYCDAVVQDPADLVGHNTYWAFPPWNGAYPSEETLGFRMDMSFTLGQTEPGLSELWDEHSKAVEHAYGGHHSGIVHLPRISAYLPPGFSFDTAYHGLRRPDREEAVACHTLTFPLSKHNLQLTIHQGLHFIYELSGRLQDITFQGIDMDLMRAQLYQGRDSAWQSQPQRYWWTWPSSPDLDSEQRREMDADSWGVPDRRSSEASDYGMESRWQLAFGGEGSA